MPEIQGCCCPRCLGLRVERHMTKNQMGKRMGHEMETDVALVFRAWGSGWRWEHLGTHGLRFGMPGLE